MGNTFQDVRWSDVVIQNCPNAQIDILDNTIDNPNVNPFTAAIMCIDNKNSTTAIKDNDIDQLCSTASTVGIYVSNAGLSPVNLTLGTQANPNTINNKQHGIILKNVSGTTSPLVEGNAIDFCNTTVAKNGIWLDGCSNVHVRENTITKITPTPTSGQVTTMRGIVVSTSQNCAIGKNNTITRMGSGLFLNGNNLNTQLACNSLVTCYNGAYFNSGTITGPYSAAVSSYLQLANAIPNANTFTGLIGNELSGTGAIPSTIWYYNGTAPTTPTAPTGLGIASTSNSDNCASFITEPPDSTFRRLYFKPVAQNSAIFSQDAAANKYWNVQHFYDYFYRNPDMLSLGVSDDSVFEDFYDSLATTNIGKFQTVQDLIELDSIADALDSNTAITTGSDIEADLKFVNDVYLRTWALGDSAFSPEDSSALQEIADKDPLTGGRAVYTAQVMLNILPSFPEERIIGNQEDHIASVEQGIFSMIYPNPNDGTMQLSYMLGQNQHGEINIYNVMGIRINSYQVIGDNQLKTLPIDGQDFTDGVYYYEIKVDKQIKASGKVIVIR